MLPDNDPGAYWREQTRRLKSNPADTLLPPLFTARERRRIFELAPHAFDLLRISGTISLEPLAEPARQAELEARVADMLLAEAGKMLVPEVIELGLVNSNEWQFLTELHRLSPDASLEELRVADTARNELMNTLFAAAVETITLGTHPSKIGQLN